MKINKIPSLVYDPTKKRYVRNVWRKCRWCGKPVKMKLSGSRNDKKAIIEQCLPFGHKNHRCKKEEVSDYGQRERHKDEEPDTR